MNALIQGKPRNSSSDTLPTMLPFLPTTGESLRGRTGAGTEIHDDTTFAEIQRLDYIGWTLPMVSLAFDSARHGRV